MGICDKIELEFIIHFAAPSANSSSISPYSKKHKCIFGENDSADLTSSNWNDDSDADSECDSFPNICSFKTETFEDLSQRLSNCENMDRESIGFSFWFELQITNIANNKNAFSNAKNKRIDYSKLVHKRPRFSERKIS